MHFLYFSDEPILRTHTQECARVVAATQALLLEAKRVHVYICMFRAISAAAII